MTIDQNPLGLRNIDYLEFAGALEGNLVTQFLNLGFKKTLDSEHLSQYEQGEIKFRINTEKSGPANNFLKNHGEGVTKIAFRVQNAELALDTALKRGATLVEDLSTEETPNGPIVKGTIQGVGDIRNEFIQRSDSAREGLFQETQELHYALPCPFQRIDHLTNNVPKGEMKKWVEFYQKIFGFQVTRYFDIKGKKTGLLSEVVQSYNGSIIIPVNEPKEEGEKDQIQEFLDINNGAGVQHIALLTSDIIPNIKELVKRGLRFLSIPPTYYEDIPKRGIVVNEDIQELQQTGILVDGEGEQYLLQIFSETVIGPSFFEIIQRKGHKGFGEGNFQALFNAIERDQVKRGYLD